jgi:hypothetical protein
MNNNKGVELEVNKLAQELELWTPKENLLDKFPQLKNAMYHLVNVLHPVHGEGGELQFNTVSRICLEVIQAAKRHHPEGKLDPAVDEILHVAKTPVDLIRHLKANWGRFHPQASLEGNYGKKGDAHDEMFLKQNEKFYNYHFKQPERPATSNQPPPSNDNKLTVMAVLNAMPKSILVGKDIPAIEVIAKEIAGNIGGLVPTTKEIEEFVRRRLTVGNP